MEKLACKIELPGRERDVRTDRLPNGPLCLFVFTNRRMHLSAFLTWCGHDAFSQGDGCLDSPSHLRSDPAVNSHDSGCEGVTEHTDRDSHYEIFKKVLKYRHSASPLSVKIPSCPGNSILQARKKIFKQEQKIYLWRLEKCPKKKRAPLKPYLQMRIPFPAQGMKAPSWRLQQAIWQVRKPESGRHLRATQRPVSNPVAVMRKEENNAAYQTKR